MSQIIIDVGSAPDDGTGDPIRDAFIAVNNNFTQIFTAGPVTSNIRIANNTITTTVINGNIVLAPSGIGVVQTNTTVMPRLDNVYDLGAPAQRFNTLYLGTGGFDSVGNITGNYFIGNGRFLSGILSTADSNIANGNTRVTIPVADGPVLFEFGACVVANISSASSQFVAPILADTILADTITANNFIGNISGNFQAPGSSTQVLYNQDGIITAAAGLLYFAGNNSVTVIGTATALDVVVSNTMSGNVLLTSGNANIGGSAYVNDQLDVVGNSYFFGNVEVFGDSIFDSDLDVTGNLTVGNILGQGTATVDDLLVQANATISGTLQTGAATVTSLVASGNVTAANLATSGNVSVSGTVLAATVSASGNVNTLNTNITNNAVVSGTLTAANAQITSFTVGNITAGNITAGNILPSANVTYDIGSPSLRFRDIYLSGNTLDLNSATIESNATAMILTNPIGGKFIVDGTGISDNSKIQRGNSNVSIPISNGAVLISTGGSERANIHDAGLSVVGDIAVSANTDITGNVAAGNANIAGTMLTVDANITGTATINDLVITGNSNVTGNTNMSGNLFVVGNITGNSITTGTITANSTIAATGNVTGGNVTTAGEVTATGNVTGGNITTTGIVTVTGNVTGGNLTTSGEVAAATANIGNLEIGNITSNLRVTQDALIDGNLTVNGNVTYVNVEDLNVEDPIIGLGRGANNTPLTVNDGKDRGEQLWYYSGSEKSAFIGYDNSGGNLIAAVDASITNEIVTVNSYGNFVGGNISGSNITSTGTVTATGNVIGGNVITTGAVEATGNIAGGNLSTTGNVTGAVFLGNVEGTYANFSGNVVAASFVGNVSGNIDAGGANTQIQFNDDDILAGSAAFTFDKASNLVTATGNISAANVVSAGSVTATGNIIANNFLGNIAAANVIGTVASARDLINGNSIIAIPTADGNIFVGVNNVGSIEFTALGINALNLASLGNVTASANITGGNLSTGGLVTATGNVSGGNIVTAGRLDATGNVTGGNIATAGIITATGNIVGSANVTAANLVATNNVAAAGNVSASYFIGNGALLSGIDTTLISNGTSNVKIVSANGNATINIAGTSNVAVFANTGVDITGALTVSGNITGGNLSTAGAGGNITGANVVSANTFIATANIDAANISSTGVITATGNVVGGNITTAGVVDATGNVVGGNLVTAGSVDATGNITSGNITTSGQFDATGNVTGGNLITAGSVDATGNVAGGNLVTAGEVVATGNVSGGNVTTVGNVDGANVNATGTVIATGNVSGGNVTTAGTVDASGNVSGGNLVTAGTVDASGNVSGGNLVTAGNVDSANVNATANVTGAGAVFSGNVTADTFIGNIAGNVDAGGANTNIQFNDDDILNGSAAFTFDKASNLVTATGNISAGNLVTAGMVDAIGNISGGNLVTTGNIDGANINASSGITAGTTITATGNVIGNNFVGNVFGSFANFTGNVTATTFLGNVIGNISGNLTVNGANTEVVFNDDGIGNGSPGFTFDKSSNLVTASGNVSAGNLLSLGVVTATGNITGGNVTSAGEVTATGNITGGNLVTAGRLVATGNVVGNIFQSVNTTLQAPTVGDYDGERLRLYDFANVSKTNYAIGVETSAIWMGVDTNLEGQGFKWYGNTTQIARLSGVGNLVLAGNLIANSNVTGANITTAGIVAATGNVSGGNITTAGAVDATGNVNAGNVNAVTNVTATTVTASGNVDAGTAVNANLIAGTSVQIDSTGDIVLNPTGNINVSGVRVRNMSEPQLAFDAATKQYVDDAVSSGIHVHPPVDVETATPLTTVTYANGGNVFTVNETIAGNTVVFTTAANLQVNDQLWFSNSFNGVVGNLAYFVVSTPNTSAAVLTTAYNGVPVSNITSGSGLSESVRVNSGVGATLTATANGAIVVDGVSLSAGNRVLVYNQVNQIENGVYEVTDVGNVTAPYILTRSSDADTYEPLTSTGLDNGSYFYVQYGDTGAGESYVKTEPAGPFIFGVANIVFTQFSASQVYTANTQAGINLSGTVFSAKTDGETTAFDGGGNIKVKDGANLVTPNIGDATGNSLTVTGNGLISATTVTATGNITGGNIVSLAAVDGVTVTASGNLAGNNVVATNDVSAVTVTATANVSAGNVTAIGIVEATGNVNGGNLTTTGRVDAIGNVTGGNINTAGVVTAIGNVTGGNLITAGLVSAGTTVTATGNVTGGNIITAGRVVASGNILGLNFGTEGSVQASSVEATGNISGGNLIATNSVYANIDFVAGDRANASAIKTRIVSDTDFSYIQTGNGTVGSTGNIVFSPYSDPTQRVVIDTSTGNLTAGNITTSGLISAGTTVTATGNVSGGNLVTAGRVDATGNVTGGNINATANVTGVGAVFSGTVTAANFIGNIDAGGANTQIQFNDGDILAGSAAFTFNKASNAIAATGNVSAGNLITTGVVTATGNVTGGNITTAGQVSAGTTVTATGNVTGGNITTAGRVDATGNVTGGNLVTSGRVDATGNVAGGNVTTIGVVSATGNVTGGNITTAGQVSAGTTITATGNVTGGNITTAGQVSAGTTITATGNVTGGNITTAGVVTATGNVSGGNVTTTGLVSAGTTVTATGNVTGGNITTAGRIDATGNVSGGNIVTAGEITASGNVTGNYFLGNGACLTGVITSVANINNGTSNVEIAVADGNVAVAVNGVAEIAIFADTGLYVTGVIESTGNITGNALVANAAVISGNLEAEYANITTTAGMDISGGNLRINELTGLGGELIAQGNVSGLNVNTGNLDLTGNVLSNLWVDGNIAGGNAALSGNLEMTGGYLLLNELTGLGGELIAQGNVTALNVNTGNLDLTGNVLSNLWVDGNISATNAEFSGQLDVTGANIDIVDVAAVGGNLNAVGATVSGNVTANYFLGNGACLTGVITSVANINNGNSNVEIAIPDGNVAVTVDGTANVAVFANTGVYVTGVIDSSGNVTGGNITTAGRVDATGNVSGGNIVTAGLVSAGTTINATGNITGGNIDTAGQVTATANITGGNIVTAGQLAGNDLTVTTDAVIGGNLTVNGNLVYVNVDNLNVEDPIIGIGRGANNAPLSSDDGKDRGEQLWYYDSVEKSAFIGYDNSADKLIAALNVTITNEVVTVSDYGNFVTGNLEADTVVATGNVTGNYFIGNGSQLTGIVTTTAYSIINLQGNVTGDAGGNAVLEAANSTGNLQVIAGNGIVMLGNATTGNITISVIGSTNDGTFWGGGGDAGLVTDGVTETEDNGLIIDSPTSLYDLGALPSGGGGGGTVTVSPTPPAGSVGDMWIDSDDGTLYLYFDDGDGAQWAEMASVYSINQAVDLANVAGNIIPAANVTYDLGNTTNRWNDIWLANSTIHIGEAAISASGANLLLPTTVQIGNVTMSESGGNLVLPATVQIGDAVLDASSGNLALPENLSAVTVEASGDITANSFIGDGSQLTGISAGISTGKAIAMAIVFGG